jgi:hypothetical protein
MALEVNHHHNFVMLLQLGDECKAPWELFSMVITTTTKICQAVMDPTNQQPNNHL